jgi:hypothetical protein|uniref:HAT C-terminal dimerisation domain-containing protein n=1 Tax=Sipha flava TaxID=143950 RepID=A0A2S2Q5A5_9HEMI
MKLCCEELEVNLKKMIEIYPNDFSPNMLDELFHLKKIHLSVFQTEIEILPLKLLNEIYAKKLETIFINTSVALRIFCTLPMTVSEVEKAFSKLGNQLNSLALLSIENKLASKINFDDIIHNYAKKKARKEKCN